MKKVKRDLGGEAVLKFLSDPKAARRTIEGLSKANARLKDENIELRSKLGLYNGLVEAERLCTVAVAAKTIGTGQNKLFAWLREQKVFYGLIARQRYIDRGYFQVYGDVSVSKEGSQRVHYRTYVTTAGVVWLMNRWSERHRMDRRKIRNVP